MDDMYMTRKEVAEWLGISLSHFAEEVQPKLPCIRIGKSVRFRKSEVEKYLKSIEESK